MDAKERQKLIHQYRDGYAAVEAALHGITEDDLDRSADGGWTPRQVVHHLADAEMEGATRIRRLVALPNATILGYDEKAFTGLAGNRPIGPSLEALRWARESTVQLLQQMDEDDWHKTGTHSERGAYGTEDWLVMYAAHAHDHAAQIRQARGEV